MPQAGIFVTATDTGVGKTLIAAATARILAERGMSVGVMKPFSSGGPSSMDMLHLLAGSGARDERELVCPYHFPAPLCPYAAARETGVEVDMGRVLEAFSELKRRHEVVIVEGVGGLRVPITEELDVLGLIRLFELPVLLVARSGLGTINHTLLSLDALRASEAEVLGVVLNDVQAEVDPSAESNGEIIERFGRAQVLARVPHVSEASITRAAEALRASEKFARVLERLGGGR